jgi:hypothetical protein
MMMHKFFFLLLMLSSTSAFAVKDGGTVYICANSDNSVKITADVSDQKQDQLAAVMVDGVSKVFYAYRGKKRENLFLLGSVKNSTLQIKRNAKSAVRVSLSTNPDTIHSQVAHSGEGVTITKFSASLTVSELQINAESVACLETKWSD